MNDRVLNPLPIPEFCDNCASLNIVFVNNAIIYRKAAGPWPYIYFCYDCKASVGCHPGTKTPLGRMADKKTRQLRREAHKYFDPLWKSGAMSRTDAYKLLARHLNMRYEDCHISQLDTEQLKYVIKQCEGLLFDGTINKIKRRKEKKNAKQAKRHERDKQQQFRNGERLKGANPFLRRSRRSIQNRATRFDRD